MAVLDELNKKYGPIPLWGWGVGAALIGGYVIVKRRNAANTAQSQSTQAAADQTNTDLGTASSLANMFEVAGLMPYQGGDTYVNVTTPAVSGSNGGSVGTGTGGPTMVGTGTVSGGPGVLRQGGSPPKGGVAAPVSVPTVPKTTTGSTPAQPVKSYTVKSGDTLIGIASKQFGLPANEGGADQLYNYDGNAATIQKQARAHGKTSDFQHWIYPGEVLKYAAK